MSEHLQPQIQMNAIQDMMVRLDYVWLDGYATKNLRSKVRYENWKLDTNAGLSRDWSARHGLYISVVSADGLPILKGSPT